VRREVADVELPRMRASRVGVPILGASPRENLMNHVHRHSLRRSMVAAVLTCAALGALAPAASAGEKVTICHATGSQTNPYVVITISVNAVKAHRAHQGRQDIIPATVGCVPPPIAVDVCPNIAGDQPTVPAGMEIDPLTGDCVTPPVPVDVCPNIPGDQPTVPEGYEKDAFGNCIPVVVEPPFILCIVSDGVTQTASTVTGTPGDDTIDCSAASPGKTIDGLAGNDTITATQFADTVTGGEGNDTITGLGGDDILNGNTGNDTISGGDGNDSITGVEGNDTLSGEGGDDFVDGGEDDDVLSGGTGVNVLIGGNGIDTCDGGPCAV
jgi:RTX calcium-binding nonapeptide repeat (4 copies)